MSIKVLTSTNRWERKVCFRCSCFVRCTLHAGPGGRRGGAGRADSQFSVMVCNSLQAGSPGNPALALVPCRPSWLPRPHHRQSRQTLSPCSGQRGAFKSWGIREEWRNYVGIVKMCMLLGRRDDIGNVHCACGEGVGAITSMSAMRPCIHGKPSSRPLLTWARPRGHRQVQS